MPLVVRVGRVKKVFIDEQEPPCGRMTRASSRHAAALSVQ